MPANTFTKTHGLGNDYLVVDPADLTFPLTPERTRLICHRHLGLGSDGILVLTGSHADGASFDLRIINPDGSEAEKSGNGIRIFAKWLTDTGRAHSSTFAVETPGGIVPVKVESASGRVRMVTADMGAPVFRDDPRQLDVDGQTLPVVALSIGNPHCVVPRERLDETELRRLGPLIETHPAFPNRTNVQFARPAGDNRVDILIWERGAGETLASGSSSCAVAAAAALRLGWVDRAAPIAISMPGGELQIRVDAQDHLWMRGPVEEVGSFTLSPELIQRLLRLP